MMGCLTKKFMIMNYQPLQYIYQPSGNASAYTLLLLHGTGGDERDVLPLAREFGTGINILSLRGNVQESGMPRFFKRLGMGVFDEQDLLFRTHELVAFVRELAVREKFDVEKVLALGYSNGANIAGSMLLLYPGFLAGAILYRPMQPFREMPGGELQASSYKLQEEEEAEGKKGAGGAAGTGSRRRMPVFMSNGTTDPTIRPADTARYVAMLRQAGLEITNHSLPAGHGLTRQDVQLSVDWYKTRFMNPA